MKIPTSKSPVSRHYPMAIHPEMRFQFGFIQMQPAFDPESKRALPMQPCFHLCGHGSTVEKAARMAGVNLQKEKKI